MANFFGKVKIDFKENIEPHEIVLDRLAKREEERMGLSERKFETALHRKILEGFFFFSLAVFLLLFLRSFQLQVLEAKNWQKESENNKFIFYQVRAERGVIYDKDFNQLVFNQPSFDLVYSGGAESNVVEEVAKIIKKDSKDIKEGIVAENLDNQTLILLETKIKDFPGFSVENNSARSYLSGEYFSGLLGYNGRIKIEEFKKASELYTISDYVGRTGLEYSLESVLRKKPGKIKIEKDALGNIISQEVSQLPEAGSSLVLFVDSSLQKKIKDELEKQMKAIGSRAAAAVAMNPKNGTILGLVSLPSFDNNVFSRGEKKEVEKLLANSSQPLFNRAISGQYPTGSTVKPLLAAAALEEEIISPEKKIYSPGYLEVVNRYNPEIVYKFLDQAPPDWYDLRRAIAFSSNVYFYTVGGGNDSQAGLGPSKIKKYLELFGWGQSSNIDLPGEAEGLIPSPVWKKEVKKENWWDGDTYNMSIGQGNVLATPLQVTAAISTIANNGKLFEPRIVRAAVDGNKKIIKEFELKIIRQDFIKPDNLQAVREGMRQAVTSGSSYILNDLPQKAAAKTGTAETGKKNYYHNWVSVFAPYDDPEIVLTILLEDVKGVQAAALPVAKGILEWYFGGGR